MNNTDRQCSVLFIMVYKSTPSVIPKTNPFIDITDTEPAGNLKVGLFITDMAVQLLCVTFPSIIMNLNQCLPLFFPCSDTDTKILPGKQTGMPHGILRQRLQGELGNTDILCVNGVYGVQ